MRKKLMLLVGITLMIFAIWNMFQPLTVTVTVSYEGETKTVRTEVTPADILRQYAVRQYAVTAENETQIQLTDEAKQAIITYVVAPFIAGLVFTFATFGVGAARRR